MLHAFRFRGHLVHKAHGVQKVFKGERALNDRPTARPLRESGEFRLNLLSR